MSMKKSSGQGSISFNKGYLETLFHHQQCWEVFINDLSLKTQWIRNALKLKFSLVKGFSVYFFHTMSLKLINIVMRLARSTAGVIPSGIICFQEQIPS